MVPGDEVRVKTPQQSYWSQKGVASTPDGATIATHENNQRICWQKKEYKQILMTTIMKAFKQFKTDHPEKKTGMSKFASFRPIHVSDKDPTCVGVNENLHSLSPSDHVIQLTIHHAVPPTVR